MAISHQASEAVPEKRRWSAGPIVSEMWTSLAISVIWLAVLFDALFGPDIVTSNGAGTNTSHVPSAIVVALFAYLATRVVAKHGFGRSDHRS
jgi:hypothetical protein